MTALNRTLAAIVEQTDQLREVRKAELHFGDWVQVTTANSTYSIHMLGTVFRGGSPLEVTPRTHGSQKWWQKRL